MIKKLSQQNVEVRKAMRGGPGEVKIKHYFNKEDFTAKCRLCAELIISPGAGIGLHDHVNEDEVFIIQRGEGLIEDSGRQVKVTAGDSIITGKGESHSIINTGTEDLVVTAIIVQY